MQAAYGQPFAGSQRVSRVHGGQVAPGETEPPHTFLPGFGNPPRVGGCKQGAGLEGVRIFVVLPDMHHLSVLFRDTDNPVPSAFPMGSPGIAEHLEPDVNARFRRVQRVFFFHQGRQVGGQGLPLRRIRLQEHLCHARMARQGRESTPMRRDTPHIIHGVQLPQKLPRVQ